MPPQDLTPPPDPNGPPVTMVEPTSGEKTFGGLRRILGTFSGQPFEETGTGKLIAQHQGQRLANAQYHSKNASTIASGLGAGDIDPQTGTPKGRLVDPQTGEERDMTPEERARQQAMFDASMGEYKKAAGVDKASKEHVEQQHAALQTMITHGPHALATVLDAHKQQQEAQQKIQGAVKDGAQKLVSGGAQALAGPPSPTAPADGSTSSGGNDSTPAAAPAAPAPASKAAIPPPPAPAAAPAGDVYDRAAQAQIPARAQQLAASRDAQAKLALPEAAFKLKLNQAHAIGLKPGTREFEFFMAGRENMPPVFRSGAVNAMDSDGNLITDRATAMAADGSGRIVDADTGEPIPGAQKASAAMVTNSNVPKKGPTMVGADGKPIATFQVGKKLYNAADMQPLPSDMQAFESSQVPKTTTSSAEHIDPVTGEKTTLESTRTTAPSGSMPKSAPAKPAASSSSSSTDRDREAAYQHRQARLDAQADKAPAAILGMGTYAVGTLKALDDAEGAMQRLQKNGAMGSSWAQNKLEDALFRHGVVDPSLDSKTREDIGILRSALSMGASGALRAHSGRTPQVIYEEFKQNLGPGQDWSALRGALAETRSIMQGYKDAAKDSSIKELRGLTAPPAPGTGFSRPKPNVVVEH